jgi:hypothetical protein
MTPPVRHVYLHSEDLDGWLAPPSRPLLPLYAACFRELHALRHETDAATHEIQVVLNSGKAPGYLEAEAAAFGGEYVIGCNGVAWKRRGEPARALVSRVEAFAVLRRRLGLSPAETGVARLALAAATVEAAIEEGKRDARGDLVLTLFPEAAAVAHRWRFRTGTDRFTLRDHLCRIIAEERLPLDVLEPHADGGLDVVPRLDGRAAGKWTLPLIAAQMFPGAEVRLSHGGDAANDLAAMEAEGVLPLSAANCPATADVARQRGGVVAARPAPEGGAVLECYAELARRGWYGPLSERVGEVCGRWLPAP